jgi:cytochrome c-type biogenesis protein CcmH
MRRLSLLHPLALLALLLALATPAALAQEQALDRRVFEIAGLLRCPTCVSESVGQSSSPIAREMRAIIQEQLEAGRSQAEILAFFQERYGDWILLEPPRRGLHLLVWLLPVVATVVGAGTLALLVRRWRAAGAAPVEAAPEDVARVRALLADDSGGEPLTRRP